jgi:hypothetical protein
MSGKGVGPKIFSKNVAQRNCLIYIKRGFYFFQLEYRIDALHNMYI